MRRGITILELLLACALLAGVAGAIVPLTRTALSAAQSIETSQRWKRAADMTFVTIDQVLLRRDRRESRSDSVIVEGERLSVRAATGLTDRFTLHEDSLLLESGHGERRVLIGDLSTASFEADQETGPLTVTLTSTTGQIRKRTWEIAP